MGSSLREQSHPGWKENGAVVFSIDKRLYVSETLTNNLECLCSVQAFFYCQPMGIPSVKRSHSIPGIRRLSHIKNIQGNRICGRSPATSEPRLSQLMRAMLNRSKLIFCERLNIPRFS